MSKLENIVNLYPHNKKVFLKVLENLKVHNKVGVVQATGTGKGKLAACFVEYLLSRKKSAKILIAAPLRSVLENYRDNFNMTSDSVKYATYSKINNLSEVDLINIGQQYDLIVLDEYHRCGAPEWFKSIQTLFNGVDKGVCKVIGLTATPIRYLDNSRDMSEELFNGNVIQGLNLEEAILDGILPGFVYNACYFGTEKVLKEVEDKLKNNDYKISDDTIRNDLMVKVKELNMIYQNRYKIENIIKDNTKELGINQKWVIFCRDKQSLGEIREFCVNWFNYKPNLYIINSDRQAEDNDRTLQEFREVKQGINVMLCVDMLNEGVHIKDLNGVIMLRKTDSPIIFLQQLGRSLEAGKDFKPIIFDLIGNYKGLKVKQDEIERTPISIVKGIEQKTKGKRNYVIVHNFTEELDAVLDELNTVLDDSWTEEEIKILKEYYPMGGSDLCIEKGIKRNKSAIAQKAHKLDIKFEECFWSKEEINILRKYYPIGGYKLCQDNGLTRSRSATIRKAGDLGIIRENYFWSEKERDIIRKYYLEGGALLCQEKGLNKNVSTIQSEANRMGFYIGNAPWSDFEDSIILKYYSKYGAERCQKEGLVNRTIGAISQRANILGLVVLKEHKIDDVFAKEIILKYYPEGASKLCRENGLSYLSCEEIRYMAKILGVSYNYNGKKWTKEEIDILKKYYPIGGYELCKKNGLNRTNASVRGQCKLLGISREGVNTWYEGEIELLKQYYPLGGADLCIEKGIQHTSSSIISMASKLGIVGNKRWNEMEIQILKEYYPLGGSELCQKNGLNRDKSSIKSKASSLGVSVDRQGTIFTEEEINILRRYYPIGGARLCQEKGLLRDRVKIKSKARILGIKVIKK